MMCMSLKPVMDNLILHSVNVFDIIGGECILRGLLVRGIARRLASWLVERSSPALVIEVFYVPMVRWLEYVEARVFITKIVVHIRELSIG